jgi:fatty-acid peroxygenase
MPQIPRETSPDSTIALRLDPYRFIAKRCRHYGTDLFETRLLLQKTVCMTGPEATRFFYDPDRFERHGAMPSAIRKTLLGQGGVQGLDGEAHRHRKEMLMALMTPERIDHLVKRAEAEWEAAADRWAARDRVVLFDAVCEVLTRAVCAWAGVPIAEWEVDHRTQQLKLLFDGAGAVGPRHLASRLARRRANQWAAQLIEDARAGRLHPPEETALHVIARHRDLDGELLSPRVAGVDLLNVLRPVVAVAVYVTFVAHALHEHPDARRKVEEGDDGDVERFVQEVRRYYPFFPAVAAQARRDIEWRGYTVPQGGRGILHLYRADHDARTWDDPEAFRPDRFRTWDGSPFSFVPQGGGDHYENHRCAGEWVTIALMESAAAFLARRLRYDVPEQDLQIDYTRLPALPKSRFVIGNVSLPGRAARTAARETVSTCKRPPAVDSRARSRTVLVASAFLGSVALAALLSRR